MNGYLFVSALSLAAVSILFGVAAAIPVRPLMSKSFPLFRNVRWLGGAYLAFGFGMLAFAVIAFGELSWWIDLGLIVAALGASILVPMIGASCRVK